MSSWEMCVHDIYRNFETGMIPSASTHDFSINDQGAGLRKQPFFAYLNPTIDPGDRRNSNIHGTSAGPRN